MRRFGDVIVCAGFEADDLVNIGITRRKYQDRAVEKFPQFPADREAIRAG
jgi:hypothetical protein